MKATIETAADALTAALAEIQGRGYENGARGVHAARLSDDAARDVPFLLNEIAKLRNACQLLGWVVTGQARAMEAARIEMAQGSTEKAMQWILNSLPDVWDDEETEWDGTETANEWWDRTDAFYRETAATTGGTP